MTDCTQELFQFPSFDRRKIEASFTGGDVSGDGGIFLLRQADRRLGFTAALDRVLPDPRNPHFIVHRQGGLLPPRRYRSGPGFGDLHDPPPLPGRTDWQTGPGVKIVFRGDSGFCRWKMLRWCERHEVRYLVGLAQNARLRAMLAPQLTQAEAEHESTKEKVRLFSDLEYAAGTWDVPRRVIAKAEHTAQGSNPRFVVTNLEGDGQALYDEVYCARGEMENRSTEQHLASFAHRPSFNDT